MIGYNYNEVQAKVKELKEGIKTESTEVVFKPYCVKVTATILNVRKDASTDSDISTSIKKNEVYTIVAEADGEGATKWGKLKSGAGWISLDWVKKV